MHAPYGHAGGPAVHWTLGGTRLALLLAGVLASAAMLGAYMHRSLAAPTWPAVHAALPLASEQEVRNAAFVRDNLAMLAGRVGALQAKLSSIDGLSRRVAAAAGVAYPAPPVVAHSVGATPEATEVMDDVFTDRQPPSRNPGSAEDLGRQLDGLLAHVSDQADAMEMLDAALTRRSAGLARLPTSMPVTDYPYLSSSYGWRSNPVTRRYTMHEGLDFSAPRGTPVLAAAGGVVLEAKPESGYGNLVEIDHGGGLVTRYAHASELLVKQGDLVARGQMVARVGSSGRSTGPHLHFEVRLAGQPLDPKLFLGPPPTAPPSLAAAPSDAD